MRYSTDDDIPEPPHLKRLRQMVMVLLVVLMIGILTIAATIVIRLGFGADGGATGVAADGIALPKGDIISTGQGDGTVLFVVRSDDGTEALFVYDAATGETLSETPIQRD